MDDNQRIREELESRRRPGSVIERVGGLKKVASILGVGGVPRPIRALVEEAFAAPLHRRFEVVSRKRSSMGRELSSLSADEWRRAVETLLPQIAPTVFAAAETLRHRPCQDGLSRKPFRAPRSPTHLADARARWLIHITLLVGEYDADITWIAERSAHLAGWSGGADIGWLLAGALDLGGDTGHAVEEILTATARGEHPTAQMGRHVTQAFMSCGRESAWEFVEKLLLAAQRQEGLRQSILESVDEAHPMAFRRMLRLILEEDLARFSSVVRAADTWFGFFWDGASGMALNSSLERVLRFLEDPAARQAAYDESDAETVYLALWSTAFEDLDAAIAAANALLASPSAEIRFVATHLLVQSLWTSAIPPLVEQLRDVDLRVAARALDFFGGDLTAKVDGERLFANLEELIARVPKRSTTLPSIVWPWCKRKLERTTVATALAANASKVGGERLLKYVPDFDPYHRADYLRRAAGIRRRWQSAADAPEPRSLTDAERTVAIDLLGDASGEVRAAAFDAMRTLPLRGDEVDRLIDLLARKPGDLRTGALARLRTLGDRALLDAADRLLDDASEPRRLAGLELLRDAVESKRVAERARARLARYAAEHPALGEEERAHVSAAASDATETATTDDALGLVDRRKLFSFSEPARRDVEIETSGMRESTDALAELILAHQTHEVRAANGEMKLLVQGAWNVGPRKRDDVLAVEPAIALAEVWRSWALTRRVELRDADGLELLRSLMAPDGSPSRSSAPMVALKGVAQWSAGLRFLTGALEWCVVWDPPARAPDFLLDGLEASIASFTASDRSEMDVLRAKYGDLHPVYGAKPPELFRKGNHASAWLKRLRWWRELFPASIQPAHATRLYGLLRAFEEMTGGWNVMSISLDDFLAVYRAGAVGEADFLHLLAGPWAAKRHSSPLRESSVRKPPRALVEHPELLALVDRVRARIVDVESARGDRVSAASALTLELRTTGGLETLRRALPALGKAHFARHFGWNLKNPSRQETLSHLVVRSLPREEDSLDAFAQWAREAKLSEARLVELAVYAPQWAAHVNHVLEWPGLEGGVWWIQAHTKDGRSWQLKEMQEVWAAEVSERTALSASDLTEGAVDVLWFAEVYGALGAKRWKALDTAAKYAASNGGHTRAQLFARAMAGQVEQKELLARIDASRHQDSVRALGLLPLPDGEAGRRELRERYLRLETFRREARKFGSQRQASEKRAVEIGLANLARTAGYRDPQRLQWAMEREMVGDLARGPVTLERDETVLQLSIDADGVSSLSVTKNGKPLKALPAALKKDSEVAELRERHQELKRQRSRVRDALEDAMCRGDRFAASELRELLAHRVLAPSLTRLVFVGDGIAGYLAEEGCALKDHAGALHVIGAAEELRVAHPTDLFGRGDWPAWQRECFLAERTQPFKQLFRELYPLTVTERGTEQTRRYAGHQVNPRQALALLGARGWVAKPDEGVSRTFHEAGLSARLGFQEAFYTPADIEGLTLEQVVFTRKGEWTLVPLDEIPPRLFSEAMRDLDLVVSVAHRGGVDPEATASTVEMRAMLVRETAELLGLSNVEVQANHVLVHGSLGEYAVHLGSAGVMLLPGTSLPIVAVHSQHRGRLFLPFADDDPRTAETLSKVLLLARDREIKDPNILEWIRAAKGGSTH